MITLIACLLVTHWISDFVLQSDWMAKNKSKNWIALGLHVLTYTGGLFVGLLFTSLITDITYTGILYFVLLNMALHFITDAITSRITSRLWEKGRTHDFFVIVGLDQLIHYSTFLLTLSLLNH